MSVVLNSTENIIKRYQRAQTLEQGVFTKKVAFNTTLYPHWIEGSECFWYIRDSASGREYRLVDAVAATNSVAFNHQALANALEVASGEKADADKLLISNLDFNLAAGEISFSAFEQRWIYNDAQNTCRRTGSHPDNWHISPDGKKALFTRDFNLWVTDLSSGEEKALTTDGQHCYVYAGTATVYGRQEHPITLEALWSPDSKSIFTIIVDTREVKHGAPLVQHLPSNGDIRPTVLNPQRRVAIPGDSTIETYRFLCIDSDTGATKHADGWESPAFYPPYAGYFSGNRGWWGPDSRSAYFIYQERGGKRLCLVKFDTSTGATEVVIEETSDFAISPIPVSHFCALSKPLPSSNELIWYSESSGWAHLYLYDLTSGALKNAITQGNWIVRNILHVDINQRLLTIQTAGRTSGRNPYYCDICRVNIDTGDLAEIVSTDHEYVVCDQISRISWQDKQANGVSHSGKYVVATRSRVDSNPVSMLFDTQGNELLTLETADTSGLPENWRWPEAIKLKSADGETDIYGVMFRPSNFDPNQSYPVLDCTYGYSAPVGAFTNNHTGNWHYLSAAAYAELGFIVVMINNRGNDGLRDLTFNTYQDPSLPTDPLLLVKYNKTDCIAGIQQLAERYSYIDLSRVGIAEFGSIPTALMGLLVYPDFYKVGVSSNPMANYSLMGALGTKAGDWPQLEQFAKNLKGKLLLIAGMLDDVMPVAMTFRMVEALQKANKDFDMLLLPNLGHGSSGYTTRRTWDYLVEHLLNIQPPDNFKLTSGLELFMQEACNG